ncbi:MAG: hypothetical protein PHH77_07455 [Victivallaceae bacterium]|nr:hypothetical protein [Victivallaceae bacterium]
MSSSMIISGIVMVAALIGMIICSKKQKTNPSAQPVAIALLIVVIISGIYMLYKNNIFGSSNASMIEAENHFYASQGYMVGKFIAKNIPAAKVLVVENEDFQKSKREQGFIAALKEGLGNDNVNAVALEILNKPKRPAGMPEDMPMMPVMEMMTSKDFDATLNANSSANVVVSVIGLPRNASEMRLWKMPEDKRPKLILIGGGMTGSIKLAPAIQEGMVSAVIMISPTAKFDEEGAPSNYEDAFKKRYILIDKSNLKENYKSLR